MITNVWHKNRDPEAYGPDAHHFHPSRYLDDNDQIAPAGFGFECVGRQIANDAHNYQHCGNVGNE